MTERLKAFARLVKRRHLDVALVFGQKHILSLAGFDCDNACLIVSPDSDTPPVFVTDFRYVAAVRRQVADLCVVDCKRDLEGCVCRLVRDKGRPGRIGYEGAIAASRYLALTKAFPKARFVDLDEKLLELRAVKTVEEWTRIAEAEALNDSIWQQAQKDFRVGMTEKELQRIIRAYMNALGDGEAFETIVCVGANAAECHHVPDDTVWQANEPLLVDMGVKYKGVCSDMTRCLMPKKPTPEYKAVYETVLAANKAAIAACKPGMTGRDLDAVARRIIRKKGYGKYFGHALGHGVGYEIHERPVASTRAKDEVLKPGMCVTIEPGIYLAGKLGVRIEDLVMVTAEGCTVLSSSAK